MSNSKIVIVGSSNMDLITYTPRLPERGETLTGSKFKTGFGGKGANQAVMAAILGSEVWMVGKVGSDFFGGEMIKNFESFGINTSYIKVAEGASSGVATILVSDDGSNSIVIAPGANDLITPKEIENASELIKSCSVLITQLEIPLNITLQALKIAYESEVTTILNPSPIQDLPDEIYKYVKILCVNEVELNQLSNMKIDSIEDALKASKVLLSRGVKSLIVTLGENGCLYITDEDSIYQPLENKPEKVVDTTGAGDCFLGTFAHFYSKGLSIKECLMQANKYASLSVQSEGTQTSYPRNQF